MKKFYMILAVIAAMTMTAQAQEWLTVYLGNWENPTTTYNGSYFDMAPTNFYVAHTGAQMIYTPDMLPEMNGKQNVSIKGLGFLFYNETYEEIIRNVKIYFYQTDATEFAVVDGVKQFFPLGEQVWEEERDYEMIYTYGMDVDFSFRLNAPYNPEKSLVVTLVCDALDDDNCTMGSDYAPFYTLGAGKAMTYTNNWTSFVDYATGSDFPDATASLGCGTNVDLPLTKFDFLYEDAPEPTEQCHAPNGAYMITGFETATVVLTNNEPGATVYYEVYFNGELVPELSGSFEGDEYTFNVTGDGQYEVVAVAKKAGYKDSTPGGVFFSVQENEVPTGISELVNGKQVAGVRYYNVAGQEMPEANGMTIVVTTYTDGTTTTAKVVK
ncbi:MAG: hypothetical protein IKX56_01095 [Muribaculaceae bacterium]|nr:hypothetical protein [Muribaculaceae bacterium]